MPGQPGSATPQQPQVELDLGLLATTQLGQALLELPVAERAPGTAPALSLVHVSMVPTALSGRFRLTVNFL